MGSKLQTETALSTTEAEFIGSSEGLCMETPIMNLINEFKEKRIGLPGKGAEVLCKVFEDYSGASIIESVPRIRRTTSQNMLNKGE